jgi:hypothetical protein
MAYANDYHYFKGLVARTGENGFNMKEVSADKAYLGGENSARHIASGCYPLYSVQVKLTNPIDVWP